MRHLLNFILAVIFLSTCGETLAQQTKRCPSDQKSCNSATQVSIDQESFSFPKIKGYDGTYQFIFSRKKEIHLHLGLLKHIQTNRDGSEDILLRIADFCDVLILSKEKIESDQFTPFSTPYIFK